MTGKPSKAKNVLSILFRALRVLIVLAVAVGVAFFLISLRKEPEKKQIVKAPPSVKVVKAYPDAKVMTVTAFGTVKPRHRVQIAVEVPGRIDFLHPSFVEGGRVPKGETILQIDQRSYKLDRQTAKVRIRQAEIDIENFNQDKKNLENDLKLAKANVELAKKELDRIRALSKNNFASKNSLDKVEQSYLSARIALQNVENRLKLTGTVMEQKQSALAMARVDFDKADLALKKTSITSDFDGFVLEKRAEKGEYLNPGQVIGTVYEKGSLDVDVRIPFEKMKWIEAFFENGKTPSAKVVVANFDGLENYEWDATVARVKASVDEKTRTLPMTLEILNPEVKIKGIFDLKPGTFVKCTIQGETVENVYVVKRHLIKPGDRLFIADKGRLKIREVGILRKFENEIYINSGLSPGDRIISSPLPAALEDMELVITGNGN